MRLTRLGKCVLALTILTFLVVFTHATSDVCWVGGGYGSCEQMRSAFQKN